MCKLELNQMPKANVLCKELGQGLDGLSVGVQAVEVGAALVGHLQPGIGRLEHLYEPPHEGQLL